MYVASDGLAIGRYCRFADMLNLSVKWSLVVIWCITASVSCMKQQKII